MVPQMVMARVGETLEQCVERYGEGKEKKHGINAPVGVKTYRFTKNGVLITVSFWHGKAFEIGYRFNECEQKLTVATFKKLQKANGGEREWNKLWEVRDRKKSASTVDRSMWGTDQSASLEEDGISQLTSVLNKIPLMIGTGIKKTSLEEKKMLTKFKYW